MSEQQMDRYRIGGAADLPERVVSALTACHEATGRPPTAQRYYQWRESLPDDRRALTPSLTSVVPIAYPSWGEARAAAGFEAGSDRHSSHGPTPKWSREECLDRVGEWLLDGGSGTLAEFTVWVAEQRAAGRSVPSVSTIRLRLRMPWQMIREEAEARSRSGIEVAS